MPYDALSGRRTRSSDASPRRSVPRPGFGYPLRGVHRRPYRRTRRRSVPGLRPSRLHSRRPYPSRGPCRPDVLARRISLAGGASASAFTALLSSRAMRPGPSRARVHVLPGFAPFGAFSPSVRAVACSREASPPTLARGNVPTRAGLRALRSEGVGWSVSGLPAPMGFRTFRPSWRPFAAPGSGLMVSPRGADRLRDRLPL